MKRRTSRPASTVVGYDGIAGDITERKPTEEASRESDEWVQLIFENMRDTAWLMDMNFKTTWISPSVVRTRGFKPEELQASTLDRHMTPASIALMAELTAKHLSPASLADKNKEIAIDGEFEFYRKDGTTFLGDTVATLLRDRDGAPMGILCVVRDITERKRAEEVLRQERELYLDLVNTQPAGVYRLRVLSGKFISKEGWISSKDSPYSFELISDRFCEILKLDRQAFEDNPGIINDLVFEADKAEFARKNIEANLRMIPFIWEGRLIVGGAPLWVHFESRPRPLEDGNTLWTGILYDITERKQAEEAAQASLRQNEVLLREVHHRVKNNMQIISSLFNLQSGHIKDEDARKVLKEGQLRIRSIALVHEKLYQSRDLSKIDFADYLRSLSAHLFQFFHVDAGRIRLETDLEAVHLGINSAVPCGLLVTELLTNALKHAFPGDRRGMVGIKLHRREDGAMELGVADDGVGFPEAVDFRKTESLGLQIVALLVGQLEGTIELDSVNGTSFTIVFRELGYKARI